MTEDIRWFVRAEITRWVDVDPQPGIVECTFTDASANRCTFIGKFYDFTTEELWLDSVYPQPGYVECEVISCGKFESGREVAEIDTDSPLLRGRPSEEGPAQFTVFVDQLVANALPEGKLVPMSKIVTATVTAVRGSKKTES